MISLEEIVKKIEENQFTEWKNYILMSEKNFRTLNQQNPITFTHLCNIIDVYIEEHQV